MSMDSTKELISQNEMTVQMIERGWVRDKTDGYDRERALYSQDVPTFVQATQSQEWEKFVKIYPTDAERHFLDALVVRLKKADTNVTDVLPRTYGTFDVSRRSIKSHNARFSLRQSRPEHNFNPETLSRYKQNTCRTVSELVYGPHVSNTASKEAGTKARKWRIDLVLFVNGLPVAMLELKSGFKRMVQNAITQYKKTRLPKDPDTSKPEPLLTFKRGALVHSTVSQYEVFTATKLGGDKTFFLPFNKGTRDSDVGNDISEDANGYATSYLQNEVLLSDNLLKILTSFVHLQIVEKENAIGLKYRSESLVFPRYHQWDMVNKLITAATVEGAGNKYLTQHSAGSGKPNSIAWTVHQLSRLYDENGKKQLHSVIVATDRTVLDDQLQDTIYQLEHQGGVVGRINNKEGDDSKSEKLASALKNSQPIIIVAIQTLPFVLKAIENSINLKQRKYAVTANEVYSSQSGSTARQLKEVLIAEEANNDVGTSSEDILDVIVAVRKDSDNLNYCAFTATLKAKTLELSGRRPYPQESASKISKPEASHVCPTHQAIEEGFILDVLKNYTNYKVVYKLLQKLDDPDREVDSKRVKIKLNQWALLHDHNVLQKAEVIVEHFRKYVMHLLVGQAKTMVVISSRKAAACYKLAFDKYIAEQKHDKISTMMAFPGEVEFHEGDHSSPALLNQKFTEITMNPGLKGRDMRKVFDTDNYQVMLAANKFQTGFDQSKPCAMYADKKLGGVEHVQTLLRLNRTYPGKTQSGIFVLDFYSGPEDILRAFQPYYQTAELTDVSDPQLISELYEELRTNGTFLWNGVEQFCEALFSGNKSNAAIGNICKSAVERWKHCYISVIEAYVLAKETFERTKKTGDVVLIINAENTFKDCEKEKSELNISKKDLDNSVHSYEFMSQIVDYNDRNLEKLNLSARHLHPSLYEQRIEEDEIDLSNVEMSHYRLLKLHEQHSKLQEDAAEYEITPGNDVGMAKLRDKEEEFLSSILARLNELFVTDNLTDKDMISYAFVVRDRLSENQAVVTQTANNTHEQAMLGDLPKAIDDAAMDSDEAQQETMVQYLSNLELAKGFAWVMPDMLKGA